MTCKPCRVTLNGLRFQVDRNGDVRRVAQTITEGKHNEVPFGEPVEAFYAAQVRREAARQRRNRNARERHDAMRSLGLVKTPYGWE